MRRLCSMHRATQRHFCAALMLCVLPPAPRPPSPPLPPPPTSNHNTAVCHSVSPSLPSLRVIFVADITPHPRPTKRGIAPIVEPAVRQFEDPKKCPHLTIVPVQDWIHPHKWRHPIAVIEPKRHVGELSRTSAQQKKADRDEPGDDNTVEFTAKYIQSLPGVHVPGGTFFVLLSTSRMTDFAIRARYNLSKKIEHRTQASCSFYEAAPTSDW